VKEWCQVVSEEIGETLGAGERFEQEATERTEGTEEGICGYLLLGAYRSDNERNRNGLEELRRLAGPLGDGRPEVRGDLKNTLHFLDGDGFDEVCVCT
jgi:hypothetical protein